MKSILLTLALLASPLAQADEGAPSAGTQEQFKTVKSTEVAAWLKQNPMQLNIFDANTDQVRSQNGIIRGAKVLASSSNYIVAQILPKDKSARLIFYCANEACTASHSAAKRALESGYQDVFVMTDGIEGWKKSGQPTEPYTEKKQKQKS